MFVPGTVLVNGANLEEAMHKSKLAGFIIDCQTDDIEADVRRLEELGAKRVQAVHTWWIMEAPTGQRFCVVRAASKAFAEQATRWA